MCHKGRNNQCLSKAAGSPRASHCKVSSQSAAVTCPHALASFAVSRLPARALCCSSQAPRAVHTAHSEGLPYECPCLSPAWKGLQTARSARSVPAGLNVHELHLFAAASQMHKEIHVVQTASCSSEGHSASTGRDLVDLTPDRLGESCLAVGQAARAAGSVSQNAMSSSLTTVSSEILEKSAVMAGPSALPAVNVDAARGTLLKLAVRMGLPQLLGTCVVNAETLMVAVQPMSGQAMAASTNMASSP